MKKYILNVYYLLRLFVIFFFSEELRLIGGEAEKKTIGEEKKYGERAFDLNITKKFCELPGVN